MLDGNITGEYWRKNGEILNLEIDYSQNILIIIKELQKRIIALYKLKLEIELYLKEQKSYDAFIYKLTP